MESDLSKKTCSFSDASFLCLPFLPLKRFTIQQQRKADVRLEALSNVPRLISVHFEENKTGPLAVKGASSESHTSVSYTLWWLKCHCDILYDNQSHYPPWTQRLEIRSLLNVTEDLFETQIPARFSQLLLNVTVHHEGSTTAHVPGTSCAWPSNSGDCIGFGTNLSQTGLPYTIFVH